MVIELKSEIKIIHFNHNLNKRKFYILCKREEINSYRHFKNIISNKVKREYGGEEKKAVS